jgi:rhamnose utilization protein RhaD (predicted bifunctional aldolase and dehydrogenase)/NAD(P)-dependent dehydrogenase (short-subunit alcohol dehydrogenase family)
MRSAWHDDEAERFGADLLGRRVYTSRLLGREPSLVLHGGGNTSVKASGPDPLGEPADLLYVKGSGWDLASIDRAGFAPVRMSVLERLAQREFISDADLVRVQRTALTDPGAPDPSVEAVLHAIIPFAFVDHTHADAIVALTNTPNGAAHIRAVFGERVLVVPYVMPGFALARRVFEMTRGVDWPALDGMILMHHGVFTWGRTARESYEAMIRLVTMAEEFLDERGAFRAIARDESTGREDLPALSRIRRAVSDAAGRAMVALSNRSPEARGFAAMPGVGDVATRGPLTPDHVIRTKRIPVVIGADPSEDVKSFSTAYAEYFARCNDGTKRMLDAAPRWAVWPGHGTIAFGAAPKQASIVADITQHTIAAMQWAESLGGWRALPESDLFDVEYWDLEQAKLTKGGAGRPFDGRVALVTGAASGIGKAVAAELVAQGAAVVTVDVAAGAGEGSASGQRVDLVADVTDPDAARRAVESAIRHFGGLDVLVSNVGILPDSCRIEALDDDTWRRALDVNLTSHQRMLTAAAPYLAHGVDPAVVIVGSKNVPAPGPGQAAYSVSKAGLTQLARVAALELARDGIRVNVVHPNAVFDTAIWTDEMLAGRAAAYGVSVADYKRSNLLGAEVTSAKVASVIVALAGPTFSCTTGAQIPIDGGNERVV